MINSTNRKENLITPEKAASFIPVFISSGIAILLIIFFVIPQYIKSNKVNLELNELIKKKNDLENIRSQYKTINQEFKKLSNKKSKIIELISGKSNLDTLTAQFGVIGQKNNIEFVSIIPKNVKEYTDNSAAQNTEENKSIIDPFLVEGTKKYLIEFNFKTNFVNLLSFLRELEFQENIILIDNIDVKSNNEKIDSNKGSILRIKLLMTIYGKL
tara:strand:- start:10725 stop:11366 length:642 start_codon:yes stop_codon:yes gene_type:complete